MDVIGLKREESRVRHPDRLEPIEGADWYAARPRQARPFVDALLDGCFAAFTPTWRFNVHVDQLQVRATLSVLLSDSLRPVNLDYSSDFGFGHYAHDSHWID